MSNDQSRPRVSPNVLPSDWMPEPRETISVEPRPAPPLPDTTLLERPSAPRRIQDQPTGAWNFVKFLVFLATCIAVFILLKR